ncbi:MAG: hypothetical protein HZB21_04160 [Deltaproteobacteria bacterium]|nr:hypothetical protein [Deltaproteobacteria bacterium]
MKGFSMEERKAVERVIERMYRHHVKTSGAVPDAKTRREMERKAVKAAESADNKKARR